MKLDRFEEIRKEVFIATDWRNPKLVTLPLRTVTDLIVAVGETFATCKNCKHFSTNNSDEGIGCNFCNLHNKGVDAGDTCDKFENRL